MRPFASTAIILAAAGATYGSAAFPTASGRASTPHEMPACWGQCFGQFNVSGTPEMLCSPKISGYIEQCVQVSCEAAGEPAAATQYSSWLHTFCGGHNPFPSGSGYLEPPVPSTSSSLSSSSSSSSISTSSAPISSSSSSSAPISGHPPVPVFTGTGGHYPFPPSGTGTPGRPPMPSCWQSCFTELNITYPEALCFEHPGTEVSQCIQASCEGSSETNAYYQWVQGFCSPATTGALQASTNSHIEPTSSFAPTSSSSVPTISHSAPEFPGTGHPPVGTGSPKPPAFPPMPECWSSCFGQFNVSHPESLCYGYPGSGVSSCIKSGCDANATQAYFEWVQSFCLGSTGSTAPALSTSSEPGTTSNSVATTSISIAATSSFSSVPTMSGTAPSFPHPTDSPSHPMIPCWGQCFAQYNISSAQALCSRHPGNMVHSCISSSCAVNETVAYTSWVQSACHVGTGTGAAPSTSSSVPTSFSTSPESSSMLTSSVVVHPTGGEPSFPTGGFPHPTGGVSYPPCWGQCFAQNHVYSPTALCAAPTSYMVGECITASCNANDTVRYEAWQHSFCNHTIVPTGSDVSHPPATSGSAPSTSSSAPNETPSSSSVPVMGTTPPPHGTGLPHPPTNYTMPACWTGCFQAYHVSDPSALCEPTKGNAVGSCIAAMCTEEDAGQYNSWKGRFCNSTMPSGSDASSSSFVRPTEPASTSSSSTSPETAPTSSRIPSGTGSFPHPTGGPHPPSGNHTTPDMPACWMGCFKQFNVSDPLALCAPSLGPQVDTCISSACNATESGKYTWWLNDFCRRPVPTGSSSSFSFSTSSSTISASATQSASVSASHSASVGTAPIGTGGLPPFPPSGTGVPQHPDMPQCWSTCFAQNHVTSPASLCHPPMGPIVDSCITSSCTNGTDTAAYIGWLSRYCNSTAPIPTGSSLPSTSSHLPISTLTASSSTEIDAVSSSKPVGTAPVGTGHSFPPAGTGVPTHPDMPVCWTQCFSQNHVTSPSSLCHPPLGPQVDSCIMTSCNSTAAAGYQGWLGSYCANSTAPISSGMSSTSSAASTSSSSIATTSSASVSISSGTAPHFPPSGTGVPQPPSGQFPSCWGACFAQNHIVSKSALCLQPTKDAVSGCIAQSCAANETAQYGTWLTGFCPATTSAAGTGSSSSFVDPVSTNSASASLSHSISASLSSTIPSSSLPVPANTSVPVPPTNGTQIPACWTSCFKEHNVPSKDALCDPELTAYVAACIEGSCEAGSSDKYAHWVGEYCDAPAPPAETTSSVVVQPSTTSAESALVPTSSSEIIVDPVPMTSSSIISSSSSSIISTTSEVPSTPTEHPAGPPTDHPQGPTTGRPQGPSTGRPGRPTSLPPFYGPPPYKPKPQTTKKSHTTEEAVPSTPSSPETVHDPEPTTTSISSSSTSTAEPAQNTVTQDPGTVTLLPTPTTITQHQAPTTMATAVKPTTTSNSQGPPAGGPPAGPPAGGPPAGGPPSRGLPGGYPAGESPWGNGPPPWFRGFQGPPARDMTMMEFIDNLKEKIANHLGH